LIIRNFIRLLRLDLREVSVLTKSTAVKKNAAFGTKWSLAVMALGQGDRQ